MQRPFVDVPIQSVRDFWNARPCNVRHSAKPIGEKEYFDEVEQKKYFVEPHIPRFAAFERWKGLRVLEVGCGIGTDTMNFARAGATVTAVDLSDRSLEIARQRARAYGLEDRIRFLEANVEQLSDFLPVEPYHLVYSFGVLHHTPDPDRALRELRRYVAPGGTLKLMVYHRRSWKALALLLTEGRGAVWAFDRIVSRWSEAQTGCPVTYTFTRAQARRWVERHGFTVEHAFVDHIFPWRIDDYVQHRYRKVWHFARLPDPVFRALERRLGWHLCLTAAPA